MRLEKRMDRPFAFVRFLQYSLPLYKFCRKGFVMFLKVSLDCGCTIAGDEFYKTLSISFVTTIQTSLTGFTYKTAVRIVFIIAKNARKRALHPFLFFFQRISAICSNSLFDPQFNTFVDDAILVVSAVKRDSASVI